MNENEYDIAFSTAFIIREILKNPKQNSNKWKQSLMDNGILKPVLKFMTPSNTPMDRASAGLSLSLSTLAGYRNSDSALKTALYQSLYLVDIGASIVALLIHNNPVNINVVLQSNILTLLAYILKEAKEVQNSNDEAGDGDRIRCWAFEVILSLTTRYNVQVNTIINSSASLQKHNIAEFGLFEQLNSILEQPQLKSTLYASHALMNMAYSGIFALYDNPANKVYSPRNIFSSVFQSLNTCSLLLKLFQSSKSIHVQINAALSICLVHSTSAALLISNQSQLNPTTTISSSVPSTFIQFPKEYRVVIPALLMKEGILNKKNREKAVLALLCVRMQETILSLINPSPATAQIVKQYQTSYPIFVSISSPPQIVPYRIQSPQIPPAVALTVIPGAITLGQQVLFTSSFPQTVVMSFFISSSNNIIRCTFKFTNMLDEQQAQKKKKVEDDEPEDDDDGSGPKSIVVGLWKSAAQLQQNQPSNFLLGDSQCSVGYYNTGVVCNGSSSPALSGLSPFGDGTEITMECNSTNPNNRVVAFLVNKVVQKCVVEKVPDSVYFAVWMMLLYYNFYFFFFFFYFRFLQTSDIVFVR
jgi:hypothetical protein